MLALALYSCASTGNISGGPRDEEPPQLLSVTPESESTNIYPEEIEFVFNENIKLVDIAKNLLVSPVLKNKPEIKRKPRSFTLQILDTLLENTTYTFNFGNAITDLNEGNEIPGFRYVFSTGNEIDQGRMEGSVLLAETDGVPETENLWAVLYSNLADSAFKTLTPNYISPISEEGRYSFENVAPGQYKLYLVRDNNFNYYFDLPNEQVAFRDSIFTIDTSLLNVREAYLLFEEEPKNGNISQFRRNNRNSYVIETNTNVNRFEFEDSLNVFDSYPKIKYSDSIRFWLPRDAGSNKLFALFADERIDTMEISPFSEEEVDTIMKLRSNEFQFGKEFEIISNQPFSNSIDSSKITLLEDSLFVAGGVILSRDSTAANKLKINHNWLQGKEYLLTFDDSTFQSIYGIYSDSLTVSFKAPLPEELSTLLILIPEIPRRDVEETQIIFQLITQDEVVVEHIIQPEEEEFVIDRLKPGNYSVQLIFDDNKNGKWDVGNFEMKLQPEEILRYKQTINARQNYEIEVPLDY